MNETRIPKSEKAVQDYYPDSLNHCYGCGQLNEHGLHFKSYWQGEDSICVYDPEPYYISMPGFVYGGLIASLIDCHCVGTATAAAYRAENRDMESKPDLRFVTASLHVNYLKPTPLGVTLEVRARVKEVKGRKVEVTAELFADKVKCASGEVIAVQIPDTMDKPS
jgi:acyl-coenzyme A thioesterase PaaI-like protein